MYRDVCSLPQYCTMCAGPPSYGHDACVECGRVKATDMHAQTVKCAQSVFMLACFHIHVRAPVSISSSQGDKELTPCLCVSVC